MPGNTLSVCEIFHSLQGESSLSGIRFAFIRLAGCNLRCTYCDTRFAYEDGTEMSINAISDAITPFQTKHVLLTGGEPLLHRETPALVRHLVAKGYTISIETNGETPITEVSPLARIIMDIKTPGSGVTTEHFRRNLPFLKPTDEIKFVITSLSDYGWAKDMIEAGLPTREILLSPAVTADTGFSAQQLAERILADKLEVRFQLQLHKLIWGNQRQR